MEDKKPKMLTEDMKFFFKAMYIGGASDEKVIEKCRLLNFSYEEVSKLKPLEKK